MGQIVNDRNLFEPASAGSGSSPFSTEFVLYEDFLNSANPPLADGDLVGAVLASLSGTGTVAPGTSDNNHPGVYTATVAAANDDAGVKPVGSVTVGAIPVTTSAVVRVTAQTGNSVFCGLGWNAAQPGSLTRRAQIAVQNAGAEWLCESSDGASLTSTTVTGFALNQWVRLTITVTDSATVFSIDGIQVAQHPTIGAGAVTPFLGGFSPALGDTATIDMDLLTVAQSGLSR